jgi:hypothetical protein
MVIVEPVPSVNSVLVAVDLAPAPAAAKYAPAPGSAEWNSNKAALLTHARNWNHQVKTSQRHSLPASVPCPVDAPSSKPSKRHSAPPVLVTSSKASRSNLQDRLSALLKETEDTIAAIDEEKVNVRRDGNVEAVNKDIRSFSAVALEDGQAIFIIGDDEDEEEAVTTTSRPSPQDHYAEVLPTVNPDSSRMIASVSASRSMTALANASSRSISDLLNAFDDAMASPRWRRLLTRSDDIARRNDSIV